ncbi:hypothetical protein NL676_022781 [Syzygium grande]|nr:hypothetical protein NL676_022781 [Syzygium grande]
MIGPPVKRDSRATLDKAPPWVFPTSELPAFTREGVVYGKSIAEPVEERDSGSTFFGLGPEGSDVLSFFFLRRCLLGRDAGGAWQSRPES